MCQGEALLRYRIVFLKPFRQQHSRAHQTRDKWAGAEEAGFDRNVTVCKAKPHLGFF